MRASWKYVAAKGAAAAMTAAVPRLQAPQRPRGVPVLSRRRGMAHERGLDPEQPEHLDERHDQHREREVTPDPPAPGGAREQRGAQRSPCAHRPAAGRRPTPCRGRGRTTGCAGHGAKGAHAATAAGAAPPTSSRTAASKRSRPEAARHDGRAAPRAVLALGAVREQVDDALRQRVVRSSRHGEVGGRVERVAERACAEARHSAGARVRERLEHLDVGAAARPHRRDGERRAAAARSLGAATPGCAPHRSRCAAGPRPDEHEPGAGRAATPGRARGNASTPARLGAYRREPTKSTVSPGAAAVGGGRWAIRNIGRRPSGHAREMLAARRKKHPRNRGSTDATADCLSHARVRAASACPPQPIEASKRVQTSSRSTSAGMPCGSASLETGAR